MNEHSSSLSSIRHSYARQINYYRSNIGKKSEIAGVIITDALINTLEKRYIQLGGSLTLLYKKLEMPSSNGVAEQKPKTKRRTRDEHK